MLIPQTAEYALRVMAHLATVPDGAATPRRDLAEATAVPDSYLSKVCRRLVVAGLLESRKGHGGGFRLSRPPESITFAEVLAAVGFEPAFDHCIAELDACDESDPCALHDAWSKVLDSFRSWAASTTLADVRTAKLIRRQGL